ncbi:CAP domain-containing protein [Actinomadura formosensis]|uniref:CAP domain-containing protein n=1 Tax=Actinomadura formosensis TaxID=60706 RepID=UPI000AA89397|nr:CAP domain-containing protein [Actinomadura formosensis]
MPARTREPPLSTPRRPGGPAGGHQPRHDGRGGSTPRPNVSPPRDELVAGGPRHGTARSGPPAGGRRPDGGASRAGRSRAKSATGLVLAVTASGLAIGAGVAIDRLVLPELRSERTSAAGPRSQPSSAAPPGPRGDVPTAPDDGSPTGTGTGEPSSPPRPAAEEQTPPLKPIHPPKSAAAKPSKSAKAAEPDAPPSPDAGGGSPGGGGSSGAEATVVSLTNTERAKEGCKPLRTDQRLAVAARRHSADMAAHDYFDHTSRNGDSPWERMEDAGYPSPGAENIAKGYPTAAAVVKGWMNSPGHRANILNCDLRAIGVGMATGPGGTLWTQDFGWK